MEVTPIKGRKVQKTRVERERELSSRKIEIFGEDLDFGSARQPIPTINGKEIKKEDVKPIKNNIALTALRNAEERMQKKESDEIKNLLKQENVASVIDDFKKLQTSFPDIVIPEYDLKKEGELERLKGLLEKNIKEKTNGTVIFYKQALILGMAAMEILAWYLGYNISGLLDLHIANLKLYDTVLYEINKQSGGKGFMERMDPTYKLFIYIIGSTLLFFVLKWKGFSEEGAIKASTMITGFSGDSSIAKELNDGGIMGSLVSLAPDLMKMFSPGKDDKELPKQNEVPQNNGEVKSAPQQKRGINIPKNIIKK